MKNNLHERLNDLNKPDPNTWRFLEKIHATNERTLKDMFHDEIRGSFLIDIKSRVETTIAPVMLHYSLFAELSSIIVFPFRSASFLNWAAPEAASWTT